MLQPLMATHAPRKFKGFVVQGVGGGSGSAGKPQILNCGSSCSELFRRTALEH